MDDELLPAEIEIVSRARRWADEAVAPLAEQWETERRFGAEAFASAADAGLTGLLAPEADGGRGIGPVALARVLEEVAAVDLGAAFSLVVHNNLVGAVARRGSAELRDRYLPDLIAGRSLGAFLLTEPGAGSDAAAITTRATWQPISKPHAYSPTGPPVASRKAKRSPSPPPTPRSSQPERRSVGSPTACR